MFYVDTKGLKQEGLPELYEVSYDAKLLGTLEYDPAKGKLTRFDAVALGDYQGHWVHWLKVKPVPVGFAFQLDAGAFRRAADAWRFWPVACQRQLLGAGQVEGRLKKRATATSSLRLA